MTVWRNVPFVLTDPFAGPCGPFWGPICIVATAVALIAFLLILERFLRRMSWLTGGEG